MTRPDPRTILATGLAALTLLHASAALPQPSTVGTLRPLPEPPLEGMEAPVQEQLANLRAAVERQLTESGGDTPDLFAGFAALGQLYLVYGLLGAAETCFWNARACAPEDGRWSYYLGVTFERQGQLEEAAAAYDRVLELRPSDPATMVRRGWIELRRGHPDQAGPWFDRLLARTPDLPAALFGKGQVAASLGNWEQAVELYRQVLAIQPDASAVQYPLGLALRQLGDMEGAREHLTLRGERAPGFPDPLITGLDTLAVGPWYHLERGRQLLEHGDLEAAIEAYRAAVEAGPGSTHAHQSLARALVRHGDLADAEAVYRAALAIDPDQPRMHHELGNVLVLTGRTEEGIRQLQRAVELTPDFDDAYSHLAFALERAGRIREAADAAAEAVRLRPEDSAAYLEQGRLRLLSQIDPRGDAESQLRRLLDDDPSNAMARLTLSNLLASRGNEEGSLEALQAILDLTGEEPFKARAHTLLAEHVAAGPGTGEEAISHLRDAIRLAPDLAASHLALGQALAEHRDYVAAAEAYRRAISLEPANADAHAGRTGALLQAGRCADARTSLAASVEAVPGDTRWGRLRDAIRARCGAE